jgi:hypothetical protein
MPHLCDFFRARICAMILMRRQLGVIAVRMQWARLKASIALHLQRKLPLGLSARAVLSGPQHPLADACDSEDGHPALVAIFFALRSSERHGACMPVIPHSIELGIYVSTVRQRGD